MTEEELPTVQDDDVDNPDLDDEEETSTLSKAPKTLSQRRQAQQAVFDNFVLTDAAQENAPSKKKGERAAAEADDERLTIHALMNKQQADEIVNNPRDYQLELFERAKKENTIAVLDTGSGKTLIAVLLLRWIIDQELESRAVGHPPKVAFFLVASVALVFQQFAVLETNLDHAIARFCGSMNVDTWRKSTWDAHFSKNKAIVCTADILLHCLSNGFISMKQINLLIFDEAHHTKKNHAYAKIIKDFYLAESDQDARPRVFGMTASPVDSKTDVIKAAQELETLLHSRIATATDASFQKFLKRKDEHVIAYAPLKRAFATDFLNNIESRFGDVSVFHKTFKAAREVAAELGSWPADQYVLEALSDNKLRKYEADVERRFYARSANAPVKELDDTIARIRNASTYVVGRARMIPMNLQSESDLSSKVQMLKTFLAVQFERPSNHRCLVFVNKRSTARLLARAFHEFSLPNLKVGFLIGEGASNLDEENFSMRQQVLTMAQFRKGDLNCLFATSVAEEGLDVPDCNLVVRFDLYRTMVQYVQSRGRARQENSKFIHMVEAGNSVHAQLLSEVRFQESAMRNFCQALPEDRRMDSNEDTLEALLAKEKTLLVYIEQSTGAKLTYGNARSRLANFVSAVPTESDEPRHPAYAVSAVGSEFVAEVLLPEGAPIRSVVGRPHGQKMLAKASAAFEACLELRRKGFLNEYLIPTYIKKLPAMRNAHLAVGMKKQHQYDCKLKPSIWSQTRGTIPTQLYLIVIDFPDGLDRPHQRIAMLTRTLMPQFPSFPVFLNNGCEALVDLQFLNAPLQIESDTLSKLTAFTLRVYYECFHKKYEDDPTSLSYWLAPIASGTILAGSLAEQCLDWKLLDEVLKTEEYQWSKDMPEDMLKNRFLVDKWDGGRRWYTKGVEHSMSPLDPVPAGVPKPHSNGAKSKVMMENILEYSISLYKVSRERNKDLWDRTQPVLETETLMLRRNMLAPPTSEQSAKSLQKSYVCAQPLRISVLPPSVVASCFVWPSIIWRFEACLIALEAAELVGVTCEPVIALAAVTKDSDNSGDHGLEERINFQHGMGENYERLEFMGDCFLKTATTISTFIQNPNDDEFAFHVKRMLMLCNKNLFEVAKELELYKYIRSQNFDRRHWYPEGLNLLEGKGAKSTEETEKAREKATKHPLGEKTIADVCEALMGAAFISHDKPGCWHPDQWENAVRAVTKLVKSEDHTMLKWDDYRAAYNKPAYQTAEATASQKEMAEKVEFEHPYHFTYPRLLRSAFMHPSQPFTWEKVPNYQRLEFLGDALLDMASISYIFYKFPNKDPQWLTEHKMAMIGNRALGMVAVTIGFHKHIRHHHSTIEWQIREYAAQLTEAKALSNGAADYWLAVTEPPKCLADIVEAYVGAVFIDSDFDYNEVQRFFDTHIQPHFADMSLYDTYANNHPCTLLTNLLQTTYGCQHHRPLNKEVPSAKNYDTKEVISVYMIHNEIVAHEKSKSHRYSSLRVAKMALERLEGMALTEFRRRFGCECSARKGEVVDVEVVAKMGVEA